MRSRRMRLSAWLGGAAVVVLLLLQAGVSGAQVERHSPPLKTPVFKLPGLDGQSHSLEEYRGKPLFLSVWASWCAPCKYELKEFERARTELTKSNVQAAFMTVNVGEGGAVARTWLERQKIALPALLAGQGFIDEFEIVILPSILVFDANGLLAATHRGWDGQTDLLVEFKADLEAMAAAGTSGK